MGDAPPTVRGIGDPTGTPIGVSRLLSEYGERLCTLRVYSRSVVRSGAGTIDTKPSSRLSMPPVNGFAEGVSPLPLRIRIWRPSRVNVAPVGYQAVGMKPSTTLRDGLPTSTTATELVSALATTSVRPSGESDTEFGVDVSGASGYRLVEICSSASYENVLNTHTHALLPHATYSRRPSAHSAIALGCSPVLSSSRRDRASAVDICPPP